MAIIIETIKRQNNMKKNFQLKLQQKLFFCLILNSLSLPAYSKVVEYHFNVAEKHINITGEEVIALAINDTIPGPTIEATEGDILRITVKNNLHEETSIHWHGLLLPNNQDGVSYVTNLPIASGETFTYEFPVKQSGTYWYHSHTGFQEQLGIYGAIILHPQNEEIKYDSEYAIVLSDWTNEDPHNVLANIKKDGDYYSLKKGTVQSWYGVIENGIEAIKSRITNSLDRMPPMDISDVGYDAFLINGQNKFNISKVRKGEKIRLRIINAGASTYFNLGFSGGAMQLIAADGINIKPMDVEQIKIALAETYDVIVTIPNDNTYELRATAEDGSGYASALIGNIGKLIPAKDIPKPNMYLMGDMNGMHHMEGMDMNNMNTKTNDIAHTENMHMSMNDNSKNMNMNSMPGMDMGNMKGMQHMGGHSNENSTKNLTNYQDITSLMTTTLPKNNPTREVTLQLTGNMERYVWSFNDKMLSEVDAINIRKGENVKFKFINKTMMHHPLHLHGHFFRVLNGKGDSSPLKHTVNIAPFETVEIEFYANEEKDWFFHCHNLYHMKTGMARIIHYEGSKLDPKIIEARKMYPNFHDHSWFYRGEVEAASNTISAKFDVLHNSNFLSTKIIRDYKYKYDVEAAYFHSIDYFLDAYIGGSFERQDKHKIENQAFIGIHYVLPLLVKLDLRLRTLEGFRLGLSNDFQLTDRAKLNLEWNTDKEYRLELEYEISKAIILSTNYDSKYNGGIGLKVRF